MIVIYLGILGLGILAIAVILMGENKGSKPSPVDLLNSLEVDENPDKEQQLPPQRPISNFFSRLNLNEEKAKEAEKYTNSAEPAKNNLSQSAAEFEEKMKKFELPKEGSSTLPKKVVDETTNDKNLY